MASIVKKPTSKYWFAAFRDGTGKQRRITTGQVDPKKAKRFAEKFEAVAQNKGNPQKVKQSFADLCEEFYGDEALSKRTVRQFVTGWLANRQRETSPATISVYQTTAKRFLEFLGADADRGLDAVSKTRITEYRNQLSDRLAPGTVNRDVKIVRMLFRSARLDGYISIDPTESVAIIKRRDEEKPRRPLTVEEIRSILAVADPEWQSLIKFGLYTGQRLSDLASLTWNQVDIDRGEVRLVTRKTGKRILLPLTGPLSNSPCPQYRHHPRVS